MKRTIFTLLLPLLFVTAHAQTDRAEELRTQLTWEHDSVRVRILNELSWELRHSDPSEAYTHAAEAYELALRNKDVSGQAWALRNQHVIMSITGDYSRALDLGWKALGLFKSIDDADGITAMYSNLGELRRYQKDYTEAKEYYQEALKQRPSDVSQLAHPNINIGLVYIQDEDYASALRHFHRAAEICRETEDEITLSVAFNNIGWVYQLNNEIDTALVWYKRALEIRERKGDTRRIAGACLSIGELLRDNGRVEEALDWLHRARRLNHEINDVRQLEETYDALAKTHVRKGNWQQAFTSLELSMQYRDLALGEMKVRDLRSRDAIYQRDYERSRNELLEQKTEFRSIIAIIASAGFLLVLVFAFFSFTAYRSKSRINSQLTATQNQLVVQEKLASLGQLTAGIAHEIQNPLNFINNFAQVSTELVEELRDPELVDEDEKDAVYQDLRRNLDKIHEHGKRADNIIRSMMMHARSSTDERQRIDLNSLLTDATRLASHGVRTQGEHCTPSFDLELDPSLPAIQVVPQDISRVVINILNNAIDAVCERSTRDANHRPVISLKSSLDGKNARIRIRDNGTGIPADIRRHMFDPFFTTKDSGKGTGLGLSISYDIIVQKHGGAIDVDSVPDEYTEFILTLPIGADAPAP
jgi:two-component system, NtrC family, sensor kinase